MCDDAKDNMRRMDQNELGSWSHAVTSADGTWMTRGHHSKNATFRFETTMELFFTASISVRRAEMT